MYLFVCSLLHLYYSICIAHTYRYIYTRISLSLLIHDASLCSALLCVGVHTWELSPALRRLSLCTDAAAAAPAASGAGAATADELSALPGFRKRDESVR